MGKKGFHKLVKIAGVAATVVTLYLYVVAERPWWVLVVVASVSVVVLVALVIDQGKALSQMASYRISRISLAAVYLTYIALAGIVVVSNPRDVRGIPWTLLVVWVLLVGFECSIIAGSAGVSRSRKARRRALLRIAAMSVVGTALAGLAAGAGGIAYGLLLRGEWQGAATFGIESLCLAGAAAAVLVGRRFSVVAATLGIAPMVVGFGVAAVENKDWLLGGAMVALGLMIGVIGIAIARSRAAVVGGFLLLGAVFAGVAAVASWFAGRPGLSFPYIVLTVALVAACVIFLKTQPVDPYRWPNADRPWGLRRHKVTIAFGILGEICVGTGAVVAAVNHEVGVATALLGTALGCASFSIVVIRSAQRLIASQQEWDRLVSRNHVPQQRNARREGSPTNPTPTVMSESRDL